jgi:predicted amidohydrolase
VKLSLWATNLGTPIASTDEWLASVEARLLDAKAHDSSLLVMPEYACAHWLSFAGAIAPGRELAWLAERASSVIPALASLAERHGVGVLGGTMPMRHDDGSFTNRAVLALPEGTFFQEKLALTPWERDPKAWCLVPGSTLHVLEWRDVRLAIAICLDVEVPALAARLLESNGDVDLLLVPSMTSSRAGYQRVFGCAKARAVELACPVAAVGTVGTLKLHDRDESNVSGAALFIPCEPAHEDGIVESVGPLATCNDAGPLLHVTAPIEACRALRRGAAQVWPPRLAENVRIERSRA